MPEHPTLAEADRIVRSAYEEVLRDVQHPDDVTPTFPPTIRSRWRRRLSIATSEWTWRVAHSVAALRGHECP